MPGLDEWVSMAEEEVATDADGRLTRVIDPTASAVPVMLLKYSQEYTLMLKATHASLAGKRRCNPVGMSRLNDWLA